MVKPGRKIICSQCHKPKKVSEFYTRKAGAQAGQTTGPCIACNAEWCRERAILRNLHSRKNDGTLPAYIEQIEDRIRRDRAVLRVAKELSR